MENKENNEIINIETKAKAAACHKLHYVSALSIAGSDPSGGAGVQADVKTMLALGVNAMTAITAITVQNTQGVKYVHALPAQVVADQIAAVMDDIRPQVVKIGMVNNAETLRAVIDTLHHYKGVRIVLDPVMVSTSGNVLMSKDAYRLMVDELIPMCELVTPNKVEAEHLTGIAISSFDSKRKAARAIMDMGAKAVLVKGGHDEGMAKTDVLVFRFDHKVHEKEFTSPAVVTGNTHGTGCTLSSAVTSYLAKGCCMPSAVEQARLYLLDALRGGADVDCGRGHGPVNHLPEKMAKVVAVADVNMTLELTR